MSGPPPGPIGPQGYPNLSPPQTRMTQAWSRNWQRYYGDGPRKLIAFQRTVLPAIKTFAHSKRVR